MPTDLVTIATTAVLSQFVGPGAKYLGEQALERAKQVASKAVSLLATVGRETQSVEPKLLLPLVQAAGLETDEDLANKWAALLANAADPKQAAIIKPSYIDILRQLTAHEALLLSCIFEQVDVSKKLADFGPDGMKEVFPKLQTLEGKVAPYSFQYLFPESAEEDIQVLLAIDSMVDSLLRHRLIIPANTLQTLIADTDELANRPHTTKVFLSSLGYDFMLAVSPPTP
jgi:hypothetical protein